MLAAGAAVAVLTTMPAQAEPQPAAGSPFRYDDDPSTYADAAGLYARLKYIPLGDGVYASFGADLRERVEASDGTFLGLGTARSNLYDLHRLLVFGDLQLGPHVRAFVQVGDHDEAGRSPKPSPLDVDRLDLAQAFVDVAGEAEGGRAMLRLGRAEMSFRRRRPDRLARRPQRSPGLGWRTRQLRRWGLAVGRLRRAARIGQTRRARRRPAPRSVAGGPARHRRAGWIAGVRRFRLPRPHAAGGAVRGRREGTDRHLRPAAPRPCRRSGRDQWGAIGQTGDAAGRDVRAFALHADAGVSLPCLPWSPHIALRADVLSGGDPKAAHVATFNALYPNVAYSTEATIEAPANLIQPGLVVSATPAPALSLQYTVEGLWRYSSRDAFYAAPLFPLVRPDASNDRYSGLEQQLRGVWRIGPHVSVTSAIVRFSAGDFIRRGGGHDETFGMTSLALRL